MSGQGAGGGGGGDLLPFHAVEWDTVAALAPVHQTDGPGSNNKSSGTLNTGRQPLPPPSSAALSG